ncbi:MAG TPA: Calx-beta domain-containing protein [Acidimicrobiales bacterium]|jgi:hypothetical protein|nr:Calx-beta domain-containing protein [Acidimicrobiales bacterium]
MSRSWRLFLAVALAVLGSPLVLAGPAFAGGCNITINDVTVTEGDSGTVDAVFTITQTGTSSANSVNWNTADDTATGGLDYQPVGGQANLGGANPNSATATVSVTGDTTFETNEQFFVNINGETSCVISDNQGVGAITDDDNHNGYRLAGLDGGVFAYGHSTYLGGGNTIDKELRGPIVGIDETPDRSGYWLAGLDGGVFAFNAPFWGSMADEDLAAPIIGIGARPQGDGIWLVGLDGGVFAFGNAPFFGSLGGTHANAPIIGIVPTSTGMGYWLYSSAGDVFPFGDATDLGDAVATTGDTEVVGMDRNADDTGYWLVNVPGKVKTFGTAVKHGEIDNPESLKGSIVGMDATSDGAGYWLLGLDGGVFAYGSAPFMGSTGFLELDAPVLSMAGDAKQPQPPQPSQRN